MPYRPFQDVGKASHMPRDKLEAKAQVMRNGSDDESGKDRALSCPKGKKNQNLRGTLNFTLS
jgi:hypothetical protein